MPFIHVRDLSGVFADSIEYDELDTTAQMYGKVFDALGVAPFMIVIAGKQVPVRDDLLFEAFKPEAHALINMAFVQRGGYWPVPISEEETHTLFAALSEQRAQRRAAARAGRALGGQSRRRFAW